MNAMMDVGQTWQAHARDDPLEVIKFWCLSDFPRSQGKSSRQTVQWHGLGLHRRYNKVGGASSMTRDESRLIGVTASLTYVADCQVQYSTDVVMSRCCWTTWPG